MRWSGWLGHRVAGLASRSVLRLRPRRRFGRHTPPRISRHTTPGLGPRGRLGGYTASGLPRRRLATHTGLWLHRHRVPRLRLLGAVPGGGVAG
ncbi:hypothetical protein, partial [Amycolatopsis acidiphila]|uniref:hypothetical protein n=1 Tax=Amycolatopsis acidiphila TaxID=715473 RepID=UPI001C97D608